MTDTPSTRRLDPLEIPEDESPDATYCRLMPLADAELTDGVAEFAANGLTVLATGVDGSLGTRQVWPSSDIDVLLLTDTEPEETIQWRVRDGYIVHRHISSLPFLTALCDGYPQSFIDTATGDWIRDSIWMLDGLASFAPISDPEGRLADLRAFFQTHRFAPEVVQPRRPLLLQRSDTLRAEAASLLQVDRTRDAERRIEWSIEALSILWLESAGRIISHKELDPTLAELCTERGEPDTHDLFRAAAGLKPDCDAEQSRKIVGEAARELLRVYSQWLDTALDRSPNNPPDVEKMLHRLVYLRHRLWASALCPSRGCWLNLAFDQLFYRGVGEQVEALIAQTGRESQAQFTHALRAFYESLSLTPLETRLHSLNALHEVARTNFASS